MQSIRRTRVLILGGRFAGLTVAMELEKSLGRDPFVEITLVNRENFFRFTPMLHEVAASDLGLTTIANRWLRGTPGVHLDIAEVLEE